MRKLLFFSALLSAGLSFGQVVFNVQTPASIAGSYQFTSQGDGSSWGLANLLDPADAILDTVVVGTDTATGINPQGIPVSNEGCYPLVNNVAGKIVMIYRNTCSFGIKCLNAQNAGAVGVIVVNREPGLVNMAGGTEGLSVTIPVTFISQSDGALLRAQIDAGQTVTVFIGNKTGLFQNDLAIYGNEVLIPRASAEYYELVRDASEYSMNLGMWVRNDGTLGQNAVTTKVEVFYNGVSAYSQTSAPLNIATLDSAYVAFSPFSQAAYPQGEYEVVYSINLPTDEYPSDNSFSSSMVVNNQIFAVAAVDPTTLTPTSASGIRSSSATTNFSACIAFVNPNAQRVLLKGVTFQSSTRTGSTTTPDLIGQIIDVEVQAWDDQFTDITDPAFAISNLTSVVTEPYVYAADLQSTPVYHQFTNPVTLAPNQRYLICVTTYDLDVFFGHDTRLDYRLNLQTAGQQPIMALLSDATWFSGFSSPAYPAILLNLENSGIGVEELEIESVEIYPNPASYVVNIPMKGWEGAVALKATDMSGKQVMAMSSTQVNGEVLTVDVSHLATGAYTFTMASETGRVQSFNVMINR